MMPFNVIILVALLSPVSLSQSILDEDTVLYRRLEMLSSALDTDSNGFFSNEEIIADLMRNDRDSDGCLTAEEWVDGWARLGFSTEFAEFFYNIHHHPENDNSNCTGFSVESFTNSPNNTPQAMEDVLDNVIQSVIDMCEGEFILYTTNNDCATLPPLCRTPPYACRSTCQIYTFHTSVDRDPPFGPYTFGSDGNFARKLNDLLNVVDVDGDSNISPTETRFVWDNEYDTNDDNCVDEMEFRGKMMIRACGGFGFSEDFTLAVFDALRNTNSSNSCDGISTAVSESAQLSSDEFNSANLEILIALCEGDPDSYTSVPECRSLPSACRGDWLRPNPTCQQYLKTIEGRQDFPFEDVLKIFYDMLSSTRNNSQLFDFLSDQS